MLIQINDIGLAMIIDKGQKIVRGQKRWYYIGADDSVPVVLVAKGLPIAEGQIWDASSGNERGFGGFCRKTHEGKIIGKLTLHSLVESGDLSEDAQIIPLSFQINYFFRIFGNKKEY
jgi:hypothetical protein